MGIEQVGVALEPSGQVGGNAAFLLHIVHEGFKVIRKPVIVLPPQANVQEVTLPEYPGIALEVPAEPELRGVAPGFAGLGLLRSHQIGRASVGKEWWSRWALGVE